MQYAPASKRVLPPAVVSTASSMLPPSTALPCPFPPPPAAPLWMIAAPRVELPASTKASQVSTHSGCEAGRRSTFPVAKAAKLVAHASHAGSWVRLQHVTPVVAMGVPAKNAALLLPTPQVQWPAAGQAAAKPLQPCEVAQAKAMKLFKCGEYTEAQQDALFSREVGEAERRRKQGKEEKEVGRSDGEGGDEDDDSEEEIPLRRCTFR